MDRKAMGFGIQGRRSERSDEATLRIQASLAEVQAVDRAGPVPEKVALQASVMEFSSRSMV